MTIEKRTNTNAKKEKLESKDEERKSSSLPLNNKSN